MALNPDDVVQPPAAGIDQLFDHPLIGRIGAVVVDQEHGLRVGLPGMQEALARHGDLPVFLPHRSVLGGRAFRELVPIIMGHLVDDVPAVDQPAEAFHAIVDTGHLQAMDFVRIAGKPRGIGVVPGQGMPLCKDSLRPAPAGDFFRVRVHGTALPGFVRRPIEGQRGVIQQVRKAAPIGLLPRFVRQLAPGEDVAAEKERMPRLLHVDCRPGDGFARRIDDRDRSVGLAALFDPHVGPRQQ